MYALLFADAIHRGEGVLAGGEGGHAEIACACRAEADAGGADDLLFVEQFIEEVPAVLAALQPDVGSVDAAEYGVAGALEALAGADDD